MPATGAVQALSPMDLTGHHSNPSTNPKGLLDGLADRVRRSGSLPLAVDCWSVSAP